MTKGSAMLLKGRLDGAQRMRLKKLLDMHYKPSEIANIVGFSQRQIYRVYIPLGVPFEKDKTGHLWINGKQFAKWYASKFPKTSLGKKQAFCLTCKQAITFSKATTKQSGNISYLLCKCPKCGRRIAKIISNHRGPGDKSK